MEQEIADSLQALCTLLKDKFEKDKPADIYSRTEALVKQAILSQNTSPLLLVASYCVEKMMVALDSKDMKAAAAVWGHLPSDNPMWMRTAAQINILYHKDRKNLELQEKERKQDQIKRDQGLKDPSRPKKSTNKKSKKNAPEQEEPGLIHPWRAYANVDAVTKWIETLPVLMKCLVVDSAKLIDPDVTKFWNLLSDVYQGSMTMRSIGDDVKMMDEIMDHMRNEARKITGNKDATLKMLSQDQGMMVIQSIPPDLRSYFNRFELNPHVTRHVFGKMGMDPKMISGMETLYSVLTSMQGNTPLDLNDPNLMLKLQSAASLMQGVGIDPYAGKLAQMQSVIQGDRPAPKPLAESKRDLMASAAKKRIAGPESKEAKATSAAKPVDPVVESTSAPSAPTTFSFDSPPKNTPPPTPTPADVSKSALSSTLSTVGGLSVSTNKFTVNANPWNPTTKAPKIEAPKNNTSPSATQDADAEEGEDGEEEEEAGDGDEAGEGEA